MTEATGQIYKIILLAATTLYKLNQSSDLNGDMTYNAGFKVLSWEHFYRQLGKTYKIYSIPATK